MTFGATTYAEAAFGGSPSGVLEPCRLAVFGALMFGALPYAGDNCPPIIIPPKPEPPPIFGGGGGGESPPSKPPPQKEEEVRRVDFETDDEECILAVLSAFTTYGHTR